MKKRLKVKEYIEYLKTLDQERGIWVAYDFPCSMFPPIPDERAKTAHVEIFGTEGVKKGDYVISAG